MKLLVIYFWDFWNLRVLMVLFVFLGLVNLTNCTTVPSHVTAKTAESQLAERPELFDVFGKKVALLEVTGLVDENKTVRSSLLGQLVSRGTFLLLSRDKVDEATKTFTQNADPQTRMKGIGKHLGADYVLTIELKQLTIQPEAAEKPNSQILSAGHVEMALTFINTQSDQAFTAIAEASGTVKPSQTVGDFKYHLLQKAFSQYFDRHILGTQRSF